MYGARGRISSRILRGKMKPLILRDFPESFETERLLVRSPMSGDGPEFNAAKLESFEELRPWMPWARKESTVEESEEDVRRARTRFLTREDLMLLLFLKGTDTLVGSSGLHHMDWEVPKFEIGYWCRARFAERGYITEAVRGIAVFAFKELGARRVEIKSDSRNERSVKVAERTGFRLEGELRNDHRATDGTLRNTLVFSLTPEDRPV